MNGGYENPVSFGTLINNIFDNVKTSDAENSIRMVSTWQEITEKIMGGGSFLSSHSKIVDLKRGLLLVEADHPACINLLQLHKRKIIRELRKYSPQLEINNIVYRVKGSDATLSQVQKFPPPVEAVIAEIERRQDKEESALKEYEKKRTVYNYKTMSALPEFKKKVEAETAALAKYEAQRQEKKKNQGYLPPDLAAKFAELEKSVLTNSKNK